jgi:hypothetical protein
VAVLALGLGAMVLTSGVAYASGSGGGGLAQGLSGGLGRIDSGIKSATTQLQQTVSGLGSGHHRDAGSPESTGSVSAAAHGDVMALPGTFSIASGRCAKSTGTPSGSYIEVLVPNPSSVLGSVGSLLPTPSLGSGPLGSVTGGIPVPNPSAPSACLVSGVTPLSSGLEGLVSGTYQPESSPSFDDLGNALADSIVERFPLLGFTAGLATTCANEQVRPTPSGNCAGSSTTARFPRPTLDAESPGTGGCPATSNQWCLFGDLSDLTFTWNGLLGRVADPTAQIGQLTTGGLTKPANCADTDGCADIGVAVGPSLTHPQCSAPDRASSIFTGDSCSLSGYFNPQTRRYQLTVESDMTSTLLTGDSLKLVLSGVYTAPLTENELTSPIKNGRIVGPIKGASSLGSSFELPSSTQTATAPSSGASGSDQPTDALTYTPGAANTDTSSGVSVRRIGVFSIDPGVCEGAGKPEGSYMVVLSNTDGLPESNSSSECEGGYFTLLRQGTSGLETGVFEPNPDPTFDGGGNSLANQIIQPIPWDGKLLGMATDPRDVADAPSGPPIYPDPSAYVAGNRIIIDLRSLNITWNGTPNSTCATAQPPGHGCTEVGSYTVTGTFDPATNQYSVNWSAGQSFNDGGQVLFHLQGTISVETVAVSGPAAATGAGAPIFAAAGTGAGAGVLGSKFGIPKGTKFLDLKTGTLTSVIGPGGTTSLTHQTGTTVNPSDGSGRRVSPNGASSASPSALSLLSQEHQDAEGMAGLLLLIGIIAAARAFKDIRPTLSEDLGDMADTG